MKGRSVSRGWKRKELKGREEENGLGEERRRGQGGGEKENKEVCVFCSLCLCVLN